MMRKALLLAIYVLAFGALVAPGRARADYFGPPWHPNIVEPDGSMRSFGSPEEAVEYGFNWTVREYSLVGCNYHFWPHNPAIHDDYFLYGGKAIWEGNDTCLSWNQGIGNVAIATPYGVDPGRNSGGPCNKCGPGSAFIGNPINVGISNKFQAEVDIELPGGLSFTRYYNSYPGAVSDASLSPGWRHSYSISLQLFEDSPRRAIVYRPDGKSSTFTETASGWIGDTYEDATLSSLSDGTGGVSSWHFVSGASSTEYAFGPSGELQSSVEADGTQLNYDYATIDPPVDGKSERRLVKVSDITGRSLDMTYDITGRLKDITTPSGYVVSYQYDVNGRLERALNQGSTLRTYLYNEPSRSPQSDGRTYLTGIVDARGIRNATFGYDDRGRATLTSHAGGTDAYSVTDLSFDPIVTNPLGGTTALTIGGSHTAGVKRSSSLCGGNCKQPYYTIQYDANGHPSSATDFLLFGTDFNYSATGFEIGRTESTNTPEKRTYINQWSPQGQKIAQTISDSSGTRVSVEGWSYNDARQPTAYCKINAGSSGVNGCSPTTANSDDVSKTVLTYCDQEDSVSCPATGLLRAVDGPRHDVSDVTTSEYFMATDMSGCAVHGSCHRKGDLKSITFANGSKAEVLATDLDGRVTRVRGVNSEIVDYTYTSAGRLATTTYRTNADGTPSSTDALSRLTYDGEGRLTSSTDEDGIQSVFLLDDADRNIGQRLPSGAQIVYGLDAMGNRTSETILDSSGSVLRKETRHFSNFGQLTATLDGNDSLTFDATAADSFDKNGNLIKAKDASGTLRTFKYDSLNRLKSGAGYDVLSTADDRSSLVTDMDGASTAFSFDGFGNLASMTYANDLVYGFGSDLAGNRISEISPDGRMSTAQYDELNRVSKIAYTDSTKNVQFSYDDPDVVTECTGSRPIGHLTRVTETAAFTTFCYDSRGRVTKRMRKAGPSNDSVAYTYSAAGRVKSLSVSGLGEVRYSYGPSGAIDHVDLVKASGQIVSIVQNVSYVPFGPIASYKMANGKTYERTFDKNYDISKLVSEPYASGYSHDLNGRVTAISDGSGGAKYTYQYDTDGRLIAQSDNQGRFENYAYSQAGDRKAAMTNAGTVSYQYHDGMHWLTGVGSSAWARNGAGAVTKAVEGSRVTELSYDARGNLAGVRVNGSDVAAYTYDGFGQRVNKSFYDGEPSVRFSYDEVGHLVGEYGQSSRQYIYLGNLLIATYDPGAASEINFIVSDALGTPRMVMNESGAVTWLWDERLNAFGDKQPTESGYRLNIRFPGQYADDESGLFYNRARYYNPRIGRYMQPDPIGLSGGLNPFEYAQSSPLSSSDSFGLEWVTSGPRRNDSAPTIVCDGRGGVTVAIGGTLSPKQLSCYGDCIEAHERKHAEDAMYQTPSVCYNKIAGLQVFNPSRVQTAQAEVDAFEKRSIPCLRKKLKNQSNGNCTTDECRRLAQKELDRQLTLLSGYKNFLNLNDGRN